ncbi:MAG: hypothetical protein FWD04_09345 [Conexibacteraceae bacterium]|nr:hypothetical protein [Conexibacteraceae bacterium]
MSTEPSPDSHLTLRELIVSHATGDLLEIEPLDLGPDAPATAALAAERGPEPTSNGDAA